MNEATGPKSTSFKLSAAGILTGLGTLITGLVQNPDALKNGQAAITNVRTAGGLIVVVVSVVAKLIHDKGFNEATITAAGSEVASEIPAIKDAFAKAAGLVESDFPALKGKVDEFETDAKQKLADLEALVQTRTGITPQMVEDAVRHILANAQPVVQPTTPPATSTSPVAETTTLPFTSALPPTA